MDLPSGAPDLTILVDALDISPEVLAIAEVGFYGPQTSEAVDALIFDRLSDAERCEMFDWDGDEGRIKPWLKKESHGDSEMPPIRDLSKSWGQRISWSRTTSFATWMPVAPSWPQELRTTRKPRRISLCLRRRPGRPHEGRARPWVGTGARADGRDSRWRPHSASGLAMALVGSRAARSKKTRLEDPLRICVSDGQTRVSRPPSRTADCGYSRLRS